MSIGGKHKNWRRRWFILTDNCLYYFKSPSDKEPRGIIPLVNLEVRDCPELKKNVSSVCVCVCVCERERERERERCYDVVACVL